MSRSLNKVTLIGYVGNDPEIKATASGTKMAKLSLATSRHYTDRSGQRQEKTEWHRITFWDRTAEIVEQYVRKGYRLYVEGRIEYSQSEGQNGTTYWTDIIGNQMIMLGGDNQDRSEPQPRRQSQPENYRPETFAEDDNPFGPPPSTNRAPARAAAPAPNWDDEDDLPFDRRP